jgi:hypothetical protein
MEFFFCSSCHFSINLKLCQKKKLKEKRRDYEVRSGDSNFFSTSLTLLSNFFHQVCLKGSSVVIVVAAAAAV